MADLLTPEEIESCAARLKVLREEIGRVLLDQETVIEHVVVALLARGHVLLEGLPGLGKTELCKALAKLLDLPFRRLQFTPDLLPGDITGTYAIEGQDRHFTFRPGPIFASVVLADEINRSSPKTQAALLEAMAERSVTVLGTTHELPSPFFVLATQNPIELEGTYPLPEAQLDRFLFKIDVPPVGASTLAKLLTTRVRGESPTLVPAMDRDTLAHVHAAVDRVHLPDAVANWIGRLVASTDPRAATAPEVITRFVRYGAGPRAALAIASAARASALMHGKPNVGFDDVTRVAHAALRHRLVTTYEASLDKVTTGDIVTRLIEAVPEVARVA